jgi:hypothetical protein
MKEDTPGPGDDPNIPHPIHPLMNQSEEDIRIKKKIPFVDWFMVKEAERMLKTKLISTISKEIQNELIDQKRSQVE